MTNTGTTATTTPTTDVRNGTEVWHILANGSWELEGVAATEADAHEAARLLNKATQAKYRRRYTDEARNLHAGWALLEMA